MKSFIVFLLILSFTLVPCVASAASVDAGTIPSQAETYFEGIIDNLDTGEDYFIYKSGDYSAVMLHGYDLTYSGSVVTGKNVTQIIFNTRGVSNGNYNYNPTINFSTVSSVQIDTDQTSICYSSLGSWATLGDQKTNDTLTYILWTLVLILFVIIIFKFFRNRRSYISL